MKDVPISRLAPTAPATVEDFGDRLAAMAPDLPKRLRQCADFIASNADRIAVSTVADIAVGADIPPSAVIRFCQIMGFSGFSELQKLYREAFAPGLPDYATRLKALKATGPGSAAALLGEFIEAGQKSLQSLAKSFDEAALGRAVAALAAADTVHIIGLRRAFPVATYLAYMFEKMSVPAFLHDGVGALDHRHALRDRDALVAITFAPYSEETLTLAQDARARGLPVVALTDKMTSPVARHSDTVLIVPEVDFGAFRTLSATIVMAMALAVAVGSAREA